MMQRPKPMEKHSPSAFCVHKKRKGRESFKVIRTAPLPCFCRKSCFCCEYRNIGSSSLLRHFSTHFYLLPTPVCREQRSPPSSRHYSRHISILFLKTVPKVAAKHFFTRTYGTTVKNNSLSFYFRRKTIFAMISVSIKAPVTRMLFTVISVL